MFFWWGIIRFWGLMLFCFFLGGRVLMVLCGVFFGGGEIVVGVMCYFFLGGGEC